MTSGRWQEVRRFTTFEQRFFGIDDGGVRRNRIAAGLPGRLCVAGLCRPSAHATKSACAWRWAPSRATSWGCSFDRLVASASPDCLQGLVLALGVARTLSGTLFAVDAFDPRLFVACAAALLAVVLVAGYLPARRAAHIDPVRALRVE